MISNLIDFVSALVSHWVVLLTGGIAVAALFGWERLMGRPPVRKRVLVAVFVIIGLPWSAFLAWTDERQARNEAVQRFNAGAPLAILESNSEVLYSQNGYQGSFRFTLTTDFIKPKLVFLFDGPIRTVFFFPRAVNDKRPTRTSGESDGFVTPLLRNLFYVSADEPSLTRGTLYEVSFVSDTPVKPLGIMPVLVPYPPAR